MADDESPTVPGPLALRVLQQAQDRVGGVIERLDCTERKPPFQPLTVPLPVSPLPLARCREPCDMADVADQRRVLADPDTEASDELVDDSIAVESLAPLRLHRDN